MNSLSGKPCNRGVPGLELEQLGHVIHLGIRSRDSVIRLLVTIERCHFCSAHQGSGLAYKSRAQSEVTLHMSFHLYRVCVIVCVACITVKELSLLLTGYQSNLGDNSFGRRELYRNETSFHFSGGSISTMLEFGDFHIVYLHKYYLD